jgi:phage-related protein
MRKIIFYKTASGKCPAVDFLDNLSARQAQKVTWVLRVIEDLPLVPTKYFKKLVHTEEIWEVRVAVENNIFRLLGFFDGSDLIIIDNAFQKKTQETPTKEIQLAEERRRDYFKRRALIK